MCKNHIKLAMVASFASFAIALAATQSVAQASDTFGTFSTLQNACEKTQTIIQFSKDKISGPGFECLLAELTPAGTGLMSLNGICEVNGETISEAVAFDFGNYKDHFEVSIPGTDGWTKMYRCGS